MGNLPHPAGPVKRHHGIMRFLLTLALLALLSDLLLARGRAAVVKTTSDVAVTVELTDLLDITDSGVILLDNQAADPAASGVIGPVTDASARLNYTHNHAAPKKITAEALFVPPGHDITLMVEVAGGAGRQSVVESGVAQPVRNVFTNIAAGALTGRTVTFTAQCTARGTRLSAPTDFQFTILFTSVDN